MTVLEKRHRDTPSALVRAEPTDELLAAFLAGRSDCTRRAYSQDLDDFRRFLRARKVYDAATALLSRGHGEANRVALAWRASLQERRLQRGCHNQPPPGRPALSGTPCEDAGNRPLDAGSPEREGPNLTATHVALVVMVSVSS